MLQRPYQKKLSHVDVLRCTRDPDLQKSRLPVSGISLSTARLLASAAGAPLPTHNVAFHYGRVVLRYVRVALIHDTASRHVACVKDYLCVDYLLALFADDGLATFYDSPFPKYGSKK